MPGPRKTRTEDLHSWRAKLAERKNEIKVVKPKRPPGCPRWVKGKAREYWRELSKPLHSNGLLTAVDVLPLALVCQLAADADAMAEQVGERTLVVWESGERLNPLIKARLETIKHLRALCNDMGMTPTARIGLPAAEPKEGAVIESKSKFAKG